MISSGYRLTFGRSLSGYRLTSVLAIGMDYSVAVVRYMDTRICNRMAAYSQCVFVVWFIGQTTCFFSQYY
jgi:hypothetical protein